MVLMPDPASANIDPFFADPTLILTCDVLEPADGKAYSRDPRSMAKRAEAYLKASGMGDTGLLRPGARVLHLRFGALGQPMGHTFFEIESEEAPWNSAKEYEGGNTGHRPGQGRLLPGAAGRHPARHARRDVLALEAAWASRSKCTTTKWRTPASARSAPSSARWCSAPTGTAA
jgi:hypothetical protein